MKDRIDQFESEAIKMLLEGNDDVLAALRNQMEVAKLKSRRFTGVGFFTYFEVPNELVIPGQPSFVLGDIWATIPGLESPVGLDLFVRDGLIRMLEGKACGEEWSACIAEYSFFYHNGPVRDLEKLRATPGWPK